MCPLLGVFRSKYYAWIERGRESNYAASDRRLLVLMRSLHQEWGGILGYRRMHACLQEHYGESIGKHRVRRLMRLAGLMGIPKKRRRQRRPARSDRNLPDLLQRDFSAPEPNRVWVTDITELKTGEGKLYLCVIKDLYDGAITAWKTGTRPTAEWVTSTVEMALVKRPESRGAILHSDHGSQYTSERYRRCLQQHGLQISMGRVRTCADNASAESVFGQLKRELVRQSQFRTRQEATEKINHYFLNLYNPWRRPPLVSNRPKAIQACNSREQDAVC
ncbi:MAG: IS3 family transposase [Gammaproteobacteria bacterium]|nr:IS3 family transposase [Gammaproteobacteria bacterium]MYF01455.1 IS3 family transposase [Gammaproteobacteria bacterium]MYI76149.1 IS3 family transposase [Gammaproteobacteria bacterium]